MLTNDAKPNSPQRILFIHHSTGGNLIREGKLRDEIKKLNPKVEFWDHSYNLYPILPKLLANFSHHTGISNDLGKIMGVDYRIILSNNSPKEYVEIFSRDARDTTLRAILNFDIIVFKNCYPTTRIVSDLQLNEDIQYYTEIRNNLRKYPGKQFIILSPPPARKETTNIGNAKRAMRLVNWLNSEEFSKGVSNIHVFDFFTLLADNEGFLKKIYQRLLPWDSHPNILANKEIAPIFAKYITTYATNS